MANLADPAQFGLLSATLLRRAGIPAALYGGLALAAYGRTRLTRDADFAVAPTDGADLVAAFAAGGLRARCEFDTLRVGGLVLSRALVLGDGAHSGHNVVDAVQPRDRLYAQRVLDRRISGELLGQAVDLVSPEDYVILKALSDRPVDFEDAASVLVRMADSLDFAVVDQEVQVLADSLRDHDTAGHWRAIVARAGQLRRGLL